MSAITDLTIKNATEGTLWDPSLKGFGIRIGKNRKTFIVLVASGRRQRIGHYPFMSLADARKEAKKILSDKVLGNVRPKQHAFDDARHEFLTTKNRKPRTTKDYTRLLDRHYDFGRRNIADITSREIVHRLNRLTGTPSEKHHAYVVGRMFFAWCVKQHIIDRSPMENMDVPKIGQPRERILNKNELYGLTQALSAHENTFNRICTLLLYTGQRRGEIARLEWSWIDRTNRTITLPANVTKNNTAHTFPYGPTVERVLDSIPQFKDCPYVFPAAKTVSEKTTVFNGWSKPKVTLDKVTGMTGWTLHDIRRSVSSYMAELGVPQIVVEKLLNHVSGGAQSQISRIYNRHHYLKEMRDAVLLWDKHLSTMVEPEA